MINNVENPKAGFSLGLAFFANVICGFCDFYLY
jgi:hypothetical protein